MPQVADKPQADTKPVVTDYSQQLTNLREMLARSEDARKFAQNEVQSFRFDLQIAEYREAIATLEQAQYVEPTLTQFGTDYSQEWSTTICPGGLLEYRGRPDLQIRAWDYKFVTEDPRQIAHLRQCIEREALPGLREMPVGLMCAMSKDGFFYDWLTPEQYERFVGSGGGRGW